MKNCKISRSPYHNEISIECMNKWVIKSIKLVSQIFYNNQSPTGVSQEGAIDLHRLFVCPVHKI